MQTLTSAEVDHFLAKGYVTIPGCFTRDFAHPLIDHAYERLGYDPDDPATWTEPIRYLDHAHRFKVKDLCPRAWGAICDVLGGEDRIDPADFSLVERGVLQALGVERYEFQPTAPREWYGL